MVTNFKWVRHIETDPESRELALLGTSFAAYISDAYGVETTVSDLPQVDGEYTWRIRARRLTYRIFDFEWKLVRASGVQTFFYRVLNDSAPPGAWVDLTEQIFGGSGTVFQFSFDSVGKVAFTGPGLYEDSIPGTTQCEYETRTNGVLTGGGIGAPAGQIGAGFDLRMLAIKSFQAIDPITCLSDPSKHTVNFKADIYALPASTSLHPSGWAPASDVSYQISAGDFATIADDTAPLIATSGKVATINLVTSPWTGLDGSAIPVKGLQQIRIQAQAVNPDSFESESSAPDKFCNVLLYTNQCTECVNGIAYNSYDSLRLPTSMGYGWSSEASMRVTEIGNKLFLRLQNGNFIRWTKVGAAYVPFDRGVYIEVAKDSSYYRFTLKDQTVYKFNVADGRLHTITDRNGNSSLYTYSGAGHLSSVVDGNGRSRSYVVTRTDGQPSTLILNGDGAHSTNYLYYPSDDPVSPNRLRYIIDPEGNTTSFTYYSGSGRLWGIGYPDGTSVVFTYDQYGRKLQEAFDDRILRIYTYLDDLEVDEGESTVLVQELSLTESETRERYITTDRYGRVVFESELVFDPGPGGNPLNRQYRNTSYQYNEIVSATSDPYLLKQVIDHNGHIVSMTYTADGNLKTMTDKSGEVTTYSYTEEIDPLPINPKHRNLVRRIQRPAVTVEGVSVSYSPMVLDYDPNGNLVRVTDAKGQETVMTYASDGRVLTVTDRNGNTTELVYDGLPFNNDSRNLLQVKMPKGNSPVDGFRALTYGYDSFDNVISIKDDLDNEVVTTYDLINRPLTTTDPLGHSTAFTYQNALLKEILLPSNNGSSGLSRKTSFLYDNAARLGEVQRDVDALGTQQMRVKYINNGYGQLKSLVRLKNGVEKSFSLVYDEVGRVSESTDSLPVPGVTRFAYEPFCLGQTTTSARGVRRKTSFDSRCQVTQLEVGDVNPAEPLEVLNSRELREWTHDELGRLVKSSQTRSPRYGSGVLGIDLYGGLSEERTYRYDELDRLLEMRFRTDGNSLGVGDKVVAWEYDPEGNVTKMTDPEGKVTRYSYYRDNLLKEVILERAGHPDRVFTYSHDLAGRLLEIQYPADTQIVAKFDDGTSTPGSGWDAKGQLLHLRYEKNGTPVRRFQFSYDPSGNRISQLDVTSTKAIKWEYQYDWLDRLISVRRAEAGSVAALPAITPLHSSYTFDASDNRVTYRDEVADKTYRYVMDDADNLIEIYLTAGSNPEILVEEFDQDADGNMITRTNVSTGEVITYQWDDFDRLVKVSSAISGVPTTTVKEHNRYDVNGIRKRKLDKNGNSSREYTAGITTSVSNAGTSSSSAPTISYVMGHQLLGAEINGNFQYFLTDALGTVRDVVDDTGAVIQSYEFNEHGLPMPGSGAASGTFSPKTYQGGLSVNDDRNDSGLYLMGHRHYAPMIGRFISRDPIGFRGGLNLFGAHAVSPVTRVDPNGLEWFPLGSMIKDCQAQAAARRGALINGALRRMGEHAEFKRLRDSVMALGVQIQIGDVPSREGGHYDPSSRTITISKRHFGVELSSCPDKIKSGLEEMVAAVLVHEMTHAHQHLIAKNVYGRGVWEPELEAFKAEGRFINASWGDEIGLGYLAVSTRPDLKPAADQVIQLNTIGIMTDQDLYDTYARDYLQNL